MNEQEYKDAFVKALIEDDGISQAILNTNSDFLSTIPSMAERVKMKNKNIFDYFLIADTITETTSIIAIGFKFTYQNIVFDKVLINFTILTHQDLQLTDEGVNRNSYIRERIKALFHKNTNYGIGKLLLKSNSDTTPISNTFITSQMQFTTDSFS